MDFQVPQSHGLKGVIDFKKTKTKLRIALGTFLIVQKTIVRAKRISQESCFLEIQNSPDIA